jgi:Flp pilus assembly pilin Flp
MDKLRAVAASVATGAVRSRPIVSLRVESALPIGEAGSERGQGLAEYSLILAGIAVVAIVSLVFLGGTITDLFWAPIDAEFGRILSDVLGIG